MGLVDIDRSRVKEWRAPEGPVVMLNLYRFKSTEARDKFRDAIATLVGPTLQRVGAEVIYQGAAGPEFVAGEEWDSVALVRYPSYEALLQVIADDAALDLEALRRSTLRESRFMVTY